MRIFEMGRTPAATTIGEKKLVIVRTKRQPSKTHGSKPRLTRADVANVLDSKTGKVSRSKILDVLKNEANPHFVRLKVITKGAIIKTEAGSAKVTSRPGQHGVINAVLVEEKKAETKAETKAA